MYSVLFVSPNRRRGAVAHREHCTTATAENEAENGNGVLIHQRLLRPSRTKAERLT